MNNEYIVKSLINELLNVEDVDPDINLFEIGLHSLKVTLLISRIYKKTGVMLGLRDVFESPSINGICQHMDKI